MWPHQRDPVPPDTGPECVLHGPRKPLAGPSHVHLKVVLHAAFEQDEVDEVEVFGQDIAKDPA